MARKKRRLTAKRIQKYKELPPKEEKTLTVVDCPETGEYEIQRKATEKNPAKKIHFPKDNKERFQLPPDKFADVQNAIEAVQMEKREVEVYADSLESYLGYDSLMRILSKHYNSQVAYHRSEEGGSLTLEEARKAAYRRGLNDK